jgi:hypothetical protein
MTLRSLKYKIRIIIQTSSAKSREMHTDSENNEKAVLSYLGFRIASSYLPVDKMERITLAEIKSAKKLKDSGS